MENTVTVKLLKPMYIGDADALRPVGYIHKVSQKRAERWIAHGLAEDPSGKIQPPPDEPDAKKPKGKSRKPTDEGDDE